MALEPPGGDSLTMLLETIIEGQRDLAHKLDDTIKVMVTKDDFDKAMNRLDLAATKDEVQQLRIGPISDINTRLTVVEQARLPKWFWPTMCSILMVVEPVGLSIVSHYWR